MVPRLMSTDKIVARIFYSWQSDLPNRSNRNLIETALKTGLKRLSADGGLEVEPALDRDTKDVPGSPAIADAILKKIDGCAVFVADVTPIGKLGGKSLPNPNVLIELGYAVKALGWDGVVMVLNEAYAKVEELPFDLRHRRVLAYCCPQDQADTKDARESLTASLSAAARAGVVAYEVGVRTNPDDVKNRLLADGLRAALTPLWSAIYGALRENTCDNPLPFLDQLESSPADFETPSGRARVAIAQALKSIPLDGPSPAQEDGVALTWREMLQRALDTLMGDCDKLLAQYGGAGNADLVQQISSLRESGQYIRRFTDGSDTTFQTLMATRGNPEMTGSFLREVARGYAQIKRWSKATSGWQPRA